MTQELQRKTDKFVITAREVSSRGMSFIIVMLGVILQASHTALLMYDIAAFKQTWLKLIVALGIGIFISSALAIFTLKHDGKNKDIGQIITVFFYFEIFTNVFYYWNSLIFSKGFDIATMQDWLYLIVAMPFAFIMPFAIKKFAGIISADDKLQFGSIDEESIDDESIVKQSEDNMPVLKKLNDVLSDTIDDVEELKKKVDTTFTKIEHFNEDDYLKKGQNVEITVGDKKTIVTLE